jgi:hypothetical protein
MVFPYKEQQDFLNREVRGNTIINLLKENIYNIPKFYYKKNKLQTRTTEQPRFVAFLFFPFVLFPGAVVDREGRFSEEGGGRGTPPGHTAIIGEGSEATLLL